ncbi:MAG: hypothetical protein K8T26_19610 [Lentisphaerae bacterium]|nr:hypothetical protein [Lentisphaerota bacterium]
MMRTRKSLITLATLSVLALPLTSGIAVNGSAQPNPSPATTPREYYVSGVPPTNELILKTLFGFVPKQSLVVLGKQKISESQFAVFYYVEKVNTIIEGRLIHLDTDLWLATYQDMFRVIVK